MSTERTVPVTGVIEMREYTVVADVNTDLDPVYAESERIPILPQYYHFNDGVIYGDEQKMEPQAFFERLAKDRAYSMGCNPDRVRGIFEKEIEAGRDILCIMCSSECSGSYNTVLVVANDLMEEHKDCRIYVVDSYLECAAAGILVYLAQEMKKQGHTLEEVRDAVEARKGNVDVYFLVDHLDYLVRGGRLNPVSGAVGSVLNIKPILHFEEGKIVPLMKCRGKNNGKRTILDLVKKMNLDKTLIFGAYTGTSDAETKEFVAMLENELEVKVRFINEVNPTIASHTGPDAVALAFCTLPE